MKNLIIKILKEETEDKLKNFFIKIWDQQKEKQGVAFYDEKLLKKLGLFRPEDMRHRIWEYYVDYMGGRENQTKEFINYLESTIFNSSDSEEIQYRISFDFKFKLLNVDINNRRELKGSYFIVEGVWDDADSGETYSIVTGQNEIDDMATYFDMQYEIGEGISDFVTQIGRKFGLMLNFVDIREYKDY
jgi:hypothetical protein